MGTNNGKTCGELHLSRGSLMKEETALSWGSWHVDSCVASMTLRWLYCISPQVFPFTAKQHKRQSRKCRFTEKGKRNFFSNTGPFCPHLPATPVMQFWQSHAGNCWKGLQPFSSLFRRQIGAAALHTSWKCLWECKSHPDMPCLLHCPVASDMPSLHIPLRLQPALGRWQCSHPPLSFSGSQKGDCLLSQRHIRTHLYHLPHYKHCHLLLLLESYSCERLNVHGKRQKEQSREQVSDSCICLAKSADWEMKEELDQFPSILLPSHVVDGLYSWIQTRHRAGRTAGSPFPCPVLRDSDTPSTTD